MFCFPRTNAYFSLYSAHSRPELGQIPPSDEKRLVSFLNDVAYGSILHAENKSLLLFTPSAFLQSLLPFFGWGMVGRSGADE